MKTKAEHSIIADAINMQSSSLHIEKFPPFPCAQENPIHKI